MRNILLAVSLLGLSFQSLVERLPVQRNAVEIVARHSDGSEFYRYKTYNLRTTGGADVQSKQMSDTAAQPAAMNYIAVSDDAGAPAAGDCAAGAANCTFTGEITLNGLGRAQGTFSHTNGTTQYTVARTFTATGTQSSRKAILVNNATLNNGVFMFEATYTAVTVNNTDTLTVTWTINY